jgi:hypothetical protein
MTSLTNDIEVKKHNCGIGITIVSKDSATNFEAKFVKAIAKGNVVQVCERQYPENKAHPLSDRPLCDLQ